MIRLDKYLADMGIGTRNEVKQYLKKGLVTVNFITETHPEKKIQKDSDLVHFQGKPVEYVNYEYYMFHKPAGCVTATRDNQHKTVFAYLKDVIRKDLFPVGRLDIDTEGLLLITNDGPLCHALLSPAKHIPKTYYAKIEGVVQEELISIFKRGIDIGDDTLTAPATLEILKSDSVSEILLTITEGRYHQVKRMFQAVALKVVYLKRISMGEISLDENLKPGEYRKLTETEVNCLKETR